MLCEAGATSVHGLLAELEALHALGRHRVCERQSAARSTYTETHDEPHAALYRMIAHG